MFIKQHITLGMLAAAPVGWYVSPEAGASLLAGSVLIDADHYVWYAAQFKDSSLARARLFFETKEADNYYCVCVLHTVEAIAVYIACTLLAKGMIFWFSVGALGHMALDVIQSLRERKFFNRKWSLIRAIFFAHKRRRVI